MRPVMKGSWPRSIGTWTWGGGGTLDNGGGRDHNSSSSTRRNPSMKHLILVVIAAALPMAASAQKKDTAKRAGERAASDTAREIAETSIADAAKLRDSIEAAIAELEAAAKAFVDSFGAAADAGKISAAQAKLEIAGVKLERLYDRAVALRVAAAAAAAAEEGAAEGDTARVVAVP